MLRAAFLRPFTTHPASTSDYPFESQSKLKSLSAMQRGGFRGRGRGDRSGSPGGRGGPPHRGTGFPRGGERGRGRGGPMVEITSPMLFQ